MNRQPNMSQIMAQAQKMQEQLLAVRNDLASKEYEGSSGGGMVRAMVTGSGRLVSVDIAPEVIDPEDAEMLGDLVVAAVNAASKAAADDAASQMSGITGGLGDLGSLLG